jgi:hypothetical protein
MLTKLLLPPSSSMIRITTTRTIGRIAGCDFSNINSIDLANMAEKYFSKGKRW